MKGASNGQVRDRRLHRQRSNRAPDLRWRSGALVLAKSKQHGTRSTYFIVEVQDGNIVVSLPHGRFIAKYYKRAGRPHLILRERTKTDDHELLTDAFQAAVNKAR